MRKLRHEVHSRRIIAGGVIAAFLLAGVGAVKAHANAPAAPVVTATADDEGIFTGLNWVSPQRGGFYNNGDLINHNAQWSYKPKPGADDTAPQSATGNMSQLRGQVIPRLNSKNCDIRFRVKRKPGAGGGGWSPWSEPIKSCPPPPPSCTGIYKTIRPTMHQSPASGAMDEGNLYASERGKIYIGVAGDPHPDILVIVTLTTPPGITAKFADGAAKSLEFTSSNWRTVQTIELSDSDDSDNLNSTGELGWVVKGCTMQA